MKKYTNPTVEITAFDFEDITMSTAGGNFNMSGTDGSANAAQMQADITAGSSDLNVVVW